jgi:hypothetical protein
MPFEGVSFSCIGDFTSSTFNLHGMMLMVPISNPWSATSFPTHEKYLYGIPHDISVDLAAFASPP